MAIGVKNPTELRVPAGNPAERPLPTGSKKKPANKPEIPKPTKQLRDKEASQEWDRMVKLLKGYRVLQETDQRSLVLYANTWSVYRQADEQLLREGFIIYTDKGVPCTHPAAKIMQSARDRCMTILKEFGMTPVSRSRAAHVPEEEKDDLSTFTEPARATG